MQAVRKKNVKDGIKQENRTMSRQIVLFFLFTGGETPLKNMQNVSNVEVYAPMLCVTIRTCRQRSEGCSVIT